MDPGLASHSFSEGWWRGLDSNQRTLARADLQSAAFNHSATSPGAAGPPCGGASKRCQRAPLAAVPVAASTVAQPQRAPISNLPRQVGVIAPSAALWAL